ncbi:MAG: hypothetical protein QXK06_03075 [Candidatus Diapherotrites archaeon]
MEFAFSLNRKGQTSIEFLFMFLIMLYYLTSVIQPNVDEASFKILEVNRTGQAKLAAMKLANAINEVGALSGDSRKTVWIFAEDCTEIICDAASKRIDYNAIFGEPTAPGTSGMDCTGGITALKGNNIGRSGSIPVLQDITLDCSNFYACPPGGGAPCKNTLIGYQTPRAKIIIEKSGTTVYVRNA